MKSSRYAFLVFILTVLPVIIGIYLKANKNIITSIETFGINQWYIWGGLGLIFIVEIFGRSYIFDKEKVKTGWKWVTVCLIKKSKIKWEATRKGVNELDFTTKNKKPVYEDFFNKVPLRYRKRPACEI